MIKIREIEKNIASLPPKKLAEFRRWYERFDAARWDKQFENDVITGKLDRVAEKAMEAYKKGKCKEL